MPVITAGGGGIATASLTLTHAQILTLPTATTFLIVPAPGAGKMLVPLFALFSSHCEGGAYTNIDAWSKSAVYDGSLYTVWDAPTQYSDATGPVKADGMLGAAASQVAISGSMAGQLLIGVANGGFTDNVIDVGRPDLPTDGYENTGLYVVGQNNSGGNFTGGNAANTLVVTVAYAVVPV